MRQIKKYIFSFLLLISIITLASCSKKYIITFDSSGGTPVEQQQVQEGSQLSIPDNPTKKGYEFDGWYFGDERWNFLNDKVTKNAELKAKWKTVEYNVTYDLAGGEFPESKSNPTSYTVETETFTLNKPEKEDYVFIGWTNDTLTNPVLELKIEKGTIGDLSFTANYKLFTYNVSFDVEGIESQDIVPNGKAVKPTDPVNDSLEYIFDGWFTDTEFKNEYDFNQEVTSDIKLYAKFTKAYTIEDNVLVECLINYDKINIPYGITSIGDSAFEQCSSLTSITIPESVKTIGDCAFYGCSSLTSITIPNSVTSIGSRAFYGCASLTSITIPEGVTSLSKGIFMGCHSLTSITIPESVKSINESAFEYCYSLTSIMIPEGVTSIGDWTFAGCSSLTSIAIPDSVTSIGDSTFYGCASLTSITIPEGVTSIGSLAFFSCGSLTSITIPESVKTIGDDAFSSCGSLTSITIPKSVTSIGDNAFLYCYKLVEIYNLSSLNITTSSIDNGQIGRYAMIIHTSLEEKYIITKDDKGYIFAFCFNKGFLISYEGDDTNLTLPYSFNYDNKIIDSYVIHQYAFFNCTSLTSITIRNSVTNIDGDAFRDCYKLTEVYNLSSLNITIGPNSAIGHYAKVIHPSLDEKSIITKDNNGYVFAYHDNKGYLIGYEGNGTKLILPESFTYNNQVINTYEIKQYAFYNYKTLTSITIPESVKTIGDNAFKGCSSLTSIEIPNSVTSIGDSAFSSCGSLTSITIPDSVTSIGSGAFYGCTLLTSIEIPNSVTSIGDSAFSSCGSLTSITIPNSVTSIGDWTFSGCDSLTSIMIPEGVTSISGWTFAGCNSLASITIPDSVTSIEGYAFLYCSSLANIIFNGTMLQWNAIKKAANWKSDVLATVVHCNDGDVAI